MIFSDLSYPMKLQILESKISDIYRSWWHYRDVVHLACIGVDPPAGLSIDVTLVVTDAVVDPNLRFFLRDGAGDLASNQIGLHLLGGNESGILILNHIYLVVPISYQVHF